MGQSGMEGQLWMERWFGLLFVLQRKIVGYCDGEWLETISGGG